MPKYVIKHKKDRDAFFLKHCFLKPDFSISRDQIEMIKTSKEVDRGIRLTLGMPQEVEHRSAKQNSLSILFCRLG